MGKVISIICLFVFLFLTGCSYVVSKHQIGLENFVTPAEEWNGAWFNTEEAVEINVIDESGGILKLAWIDRKDKEFKLETVTFQIKKGKKWLYLNVLEFPDKKVDGYYFWGRIKKESRRIVFWLPSVEAFRKASEEDLVQAIIEKTDTEQYVKQYIKSVKLVDQPETIIDLVENNGGGFFQWEDPIVLIKINN